MKPKILLVYTGGTIGMRRHPETGSLAPLNFDRLLDRVGELRQLDCDIHHVSVADPKDSSEIEAADWIEIRDLILTNETDYDGFVVLHGSDTMSYSASALSFLLLGLNKPVVFTGSQLPIGDLRTDAKENLITSAQIASLRSTSNEPILREVGLYFEYKLYRANRSIKLSAEHFEAFSSPNMQPLITAGVHLEYDTRNFIQTRAIPGIRSLANIPASVYLLKLHPNMSEWAFRLVEQADGIKTVVLETFGAGNAMKSKQLVQMLQYCQENEIAIINCTQCAKGSVSMGMYEASSGFKKFGVLDGGDMTTEATLAKALVLGALDLEVEIFKKMLISSLCGEISRK